MNLQPLVIIGSGAVARLAAQIVHDINVVRPTFKLNGAVDDDERKHGSSIGEMTVLGGLDWIKEHQDNQLVIAVGNSTARSNILTRINELSPGATFASLVHPRAWISERVSIGPGSIIYPDVLIDPDVEFGPHCIINKSCTIGHDTVIGEFVTLAPAVNIGGSVHLGRGVEMGINSSTIQGVSIGARSIIGAGACVVTDIESDVVAVGVPARVIKRRVV